MFLYWVGLYLGLEASSSSVIVHRRWLWWASATTGRYSVVSQVEACTEPTSFLGKINPKNTAIKHCTAESLSCHDSIITVGCINEGERPFGNYPCNVGKLSDDISELLFSSALSIAFDLK